MIPEAIGEPPRAAIPDLENTMSRRFLRVLEKWIPVGLEYFEDWPDRPDCGHFLGGCHWYGQETAFCSLVFALAASSPEYDEKAGRCSRDELRRIALKGIRYLCFTHDSGPAECVRPKRGLGRPENCGTKWGERGKGFFRESQCGTTVLCMAIAVLLLGDMVDDETWAMLAAVHGDYAGRFGEMEPRSGVYSDTQAEENGWTSCGLASAALLLRRHPKAPVWERTARRWMFATATAPQDEKNGAVIEDGEPVSRLVRSSGAATRVFTLLPDYMAENHGIVHPTYTASALFHTAQLACLYGAFGARLPRHALFNRERIYGQLKFMTERNGYFHPVQGMDWAYLSPDPGTPSHAAAAVLLGDPDAAALERRALATLETRQEGNAGRMIARTICEKCRDIQDPMIMREILIYLPALTCLLHRIY
ncbi:MAG: hypothetical protein N3A38_02605 [Planctomycetota bacterium]|nr:hypothetical protein [Planctomycetota bacterium]